MPDSRASFEIARYADRLNIKRLVVVPVLINDSRSLAINTLKRLRVLQLTFSSCLGNSA